MRKRTPLAGAALFAVIVAIAAVMAEAKPSMFPAILSATASGTLALSSVSFTNAIFVGGIKRRRPRQKPVFEITSSSLPLIPNSFGICAAEKAL